MPIPYKLLDVSSWHCQINKQKYQINVWKKKKQMWFELECNCETVLTVNNNNQCNIKSTCQKLPLIECVPISYRNYIYNNSTSPFN